MPQLRPTIGIALIAALTFLLSLPATAQTGTISGRVTDAESGDALPGANVAIVGTTVGVISTLDGSYSFTASAGTHVVRASFVGFKMVEATVIVSSGGTSTQNFALVPDLIGAGEVVVIGTRREGRTVIESPVPVDVISTADIEASGLSETTQILQMLIPSYNAPQASITDGSDHVRPATLRGLGPDQVLILVNGKRRHTSALVHVNGSVGRGSTGVDLNAIPASSIERVEVLRDGAAAQYGSDAIAGVINIVLKERAGLDASISYGQHASSTERGTEDVTYSDGETVNVNLGYGFEVADGNFYVSASLRDRGFVNRAGLDPRQQYYDGFTGGTFTEDTFPRLNHRYGNGEFEDKSVFLNGSVPIGDSGAQFYMFSGLSAREGLSGCFYRRSLDNRTNRSLYPDGFLPKINSKVNDISGAAGVKGSAGGWAYDVSETVGTNSFTFDMVDTHNASMSGSPTEFDAGTLNFSQSNTNVDLFRSVDIGTASPMSVAIGGEFRWENYKIDAGDPNSYANGGRLVADGPNAGASTAPGSQCFPGFQPASAQDETRSNVGVYIDLENNMTSRFLWTLAARFENYSDFGSTATGKLGLRYEITPEIAARGAVSTGFRAPSLAQAWFTSIATNFIDGVPFEVGTFPVSSQVARALGAQDLDPEKSLNISAGLTFSKNNTSLSVDAFQIEIDDRITFTENFTDPAVADFLNASGITATGGRFFTNAIDTRTRGLDVIARHGLRMGPGTARFTFAMNINETEVTNKGSDGAIAAPASLQALNENDLVGRVRVGDFEVAQPGSKVNFQVNYDVNDFRFMVRANRYGEVTSLNSNSSRDQTFSSKVLTDLEAAYTVRDGVSIAVGANNLFDVYPDKQIDANSFNGVFPYNGFSPFGFFGRFIYTRVNLHF